MLRLSLVALLTMLPLISVAQTIFNQNLSLPAGSGQLQASLMLPKSSSPIPVALLIAGSGPTDRNGNNPYGGHSDSLKLLAQGLARAGVASVRYDKRGVAASTSVAPDERELTVEAYVDDAVAWGQLLQADPRFSDLVLIGHSEGALIASLAAPKLEAKALISIAGSGRPIDQVLHEQLSYRLPKTLLARSEQILNGLKQGQLQTDIPSALNALFRPSVQPYLISLFAYDPVQALANARTPTLIIQGDKDIQVTVQDALTLSQALPEAGVALVPGMNHALRIVSHDHQPLVGYNEPKQPLANQLMQAIAAFLQDQGILPGSRNR